MIDEGQVEKIKAETQPKEAEKKEKTADAPVKKKNISQVFHPQNSRTGITRPPRSGQRPARPGQPGEKRGQGRPGVQGKPQGQAAQGGSQNQAAQGRPQSQAVQGSQGVQAKPQGQTGQGVQNQTAQNRPQGQASTSAGQSRSAGQNGTAPAGRSQGAAGEQGRTQSRNDRPVTAQSGERRGQGQGGDRRSQGTDRQGTERRGQGGDRRGQGTDRQGTERRGQGGDRRSQGTDRQGTERRGQGGDRRSQSMDRQGTERRGQGQGGDRRGQGRGQSIPKAPAMEKPLTKESRNRTDRDRKTERANVDKFDKLERTSLKNQGNRPNQKNTGGKNGKNVKGAAKPAVQEKKEEEIKTIILPETMTIGELAEKMKVQPAAVIKKLFMQGKVVTVNQDIDYDTAEEIAMDFNCIAEKEVKVDVIEELLREDEEDESKMVPRPPVVCVMGHVDHGKTSLLDAIRNTHVIAKEAGGITQHIGAYVVEINGQKITFLDTPGHEAFTAMRMRGANSTDIAILVVAADDGVMPQTVEAISHAKAAGIEIIVAVNKIDKPSANVERVKQELSEYGLVPEDWGGSTIFVPVSAHTHEGIDQLLEMILLTAEISELKANPNRKARGLVLEAQLDKGKGPVATVLVQKGTLRVGDPVAAGACHGKVRAMMDDKGRRVKEAGPSTPVEILGLSDVPNAGEIFVVTANEKEARSFAETFISQSKEKLLEETKSKMSLDDLFSQIQAGNLKELGIIVKADVQGSVEAVKQSLLKLSNEEVVVKIIHSGVGAINESDVTLAATSNAIIIGFNVRPDATAKATAEREGVDVRLYRVIYDAIADVEAAMKGMLDPVYEEKVIGHAEVRQTFKASGVGTIAGSYVLDGVFQRSCKIRISREGKQIYEGSLASLKRFKDDVKEVKAGYECGLVFDKFNDLQEFDQIEAYIMVEVPR